MPALSPDATTRAGRGDLRHRLGFLAVAVFLLVVVLLLPFSVGSVISDVVSPQANHIYTLTPPDPRAATTTLLNLNVIGLDEWLQLATVRVSGQHICSAACPFTERVLFVSIPPARQNGQGLPPSQSIDFPDTSQVVTRDIQLPVSGEPVHYPFDVYHLKVAAIQQRVYPDGHIVSLDGSAASGTLFLSLHMEASRLVISRPNPIDLDSLPDEGTLYNWVSAYSMTFARPLYLQVLTVLLVMLVTAAAAYAVFMRPLDQLVINAGALILGVWGIRAILLGTGVPGVTAVDLCLILVILFLLVAMTIRTMRYLYPLSGLRLLPARPRGTAQEAAVAAEVEATRQTEP
jgi:hypothetical protein